MFDIKKFLAENRTVNEAGCQGCGWNTEPDREKYCKTCDPSGERETRRKKSDMKEGLNEAPDDDVSMKAWSALRAFDELLFDLDNLKRSGTLVTMNVVPRAQALVKKARSEIQRLAKGKGK